ncbi:unnamed protein product, partial [Closterium sp. NIES-54]
HRKVHWDAAKRVLRYLCSTSGMGLVLGGRAQVVLTGHADAAWHDNDPKHTCKLVKNYLAQQPYSILPWPASSPDHDPIEHLWVYLKKQLVAYPCPPAGIRELWDRIQVEWEKIPAAWCTELIDIMPRRLRAVLKAKGRWAKLRGDFVIHPELALPFLTGLVTLVLPLVLPPTIAPLQTLHMDVWGPARVSGQDRERYFMMVVDDYTRYTTIFPLLRKGEVPDVLIHWIRAVRLQLRERFREDLPVVRLHSDRGVMEVARTSMIHAAALHFLWPFAGSRAFVRDTSADKLFSRTILCVFLGFPADAPGWQFYHPTLRHVLPSQDATFDESFPFYRLFPYCTAPLPPPPPLFLAPGPPQIDHLPPQGPAPSYVSQVDPLPETVLVEVAVYSGTARGAASGGAEPEDASSGGAEPKGTAYAGGPAGALP